MTAYSNCCWLVFALIIGIAFVLTLCILVRMHWCVSYNRRSHECVNSYVYMSPFDHTRVCRLTPSATSHSRWGRLHGCWYLWWGWAYDNSVVLSVTLTSLPLSLPPYHPSPWYVRTQTLIHDLFSTRRGVCERNTRHALTAAGESDPTGYLKPPYVE